MNTAYDHMLMSQTLSKCILFWSGVCAFVCAPTHAVRPAPSPEALSSPARGSTGRWLWPRQPEEQLLHLHVLHSDHKTASQVRNPQRGPQMVNNVSLFLFYYPDELTLGSKEALFLLSSSSTLWRISGVMFLASNVAMSSLTPRLARKLQMKRY